MKKLFDWLLMTVISLAIVSACVVAVVMIVPAAIFMAIECVAPLFGWPVPSFGVLQDIWLVFLALVLCVSLFLGDKGDV